ncbi:uncharacterized protein BXZ73DRAFT_105183 [Epithele typhae]|uniref:uncharacterized protein n=1 Tax=Epithele typhae TaxID=378194 RepID=UPI0020079DB0|nr:uncharacterized protein BXZ73DRAFT_105183 [Epithele typhae]KAH9918548.1 hypothetical protein BXZ73DRAFT_105183 [Epithele typhae]
MNVCLAPNLVAFFGVFMRLQRVGYLILSDSTAPGFARADIAVRKAPLEPTSAMHMFMTGHPLPWWSRIQAPFQPCTLLVLCRVDAVALSSLVEADLVRRVFEDRSWAPVRGTVFVITELEYVHRSKSVRVRMSETRVVRMREEEEEEWCTVPGRGENRSQDERARLSAPPVHEASGDPFFRVRVADLERSAALDETTWGPGPVGLNLLRTAGGTRCCSIARCQL